jgi:hypothetical protein
VSIGGRRVSIETKEASPLSLLIQRPEGYPQISQMDADFKFRDTGSVLKTKKALEQIQK